jgi:hexokinase
MKHPEKFLKEHKLRASDFDMEKLVKVFMEDMEAGLMGRENSLRMIPTYIEADNNFLTEVPVLAIDAGGTYFRAAQIMFSRTGKIERGEIASYSMPGLKKEIPAKEFFTTIANYIRPLAVNTERIGFCFSYPTEILPNRDGRLIQFCKEVQAPEVVGKLIGKNLLDTLGTPDKQIVLLNDTVATLLSGKSSSLNKKYDSFVGFILGTGTNTCYIESNCNILKNKDLDQNRSQIINIESGDFGKAPYTDLDIQFDNSTMNPGSYTFEKMFSGGYFGRLSLFVLKTAAGEGVFTPGAASMIKSLTDLTANDANDFISDPRSDKSTINSCFSNADDVEKCRHIIDALIRRAAKLVAANLAAVVLKTEKGRLAERPVLITIEGTTFYRMHNLRSLFEYYLEEYLSGERKRYVEFMQVGQSSLIGAALAALIDIK